MNYERWSRVIFFSSGSIGDFLMIINLFDVIKKNLPHVECIIVVPNRVAVLEQFLEMYSYSVINIQRKSFFSSIKSFFQLLNSKNLVITPHTFGALSWWIHIVARVFAWRGDLIGFKNTHTLSLFYTRLIEFDVHKMIFDNFRMLLTNLGFADVHDEIAFKYNHDEKILKKLGYTSKSYIVIHPFAANSQRSLPEERWISLIHQLQKKFSTLKIIITGGRDNKNQAKHIVKGFSEKVNAYAGDLTISELATIINESVCFVGVDTGITHLASLLKKQSVIIGNNSNPTWLPYYNPNAIILLNTTRCTCRGDKSGDCFELLNGQKYYRCMLDISQDEIVNSIVKIIKNTSTYGK